MADLPLIGIHYNVEPTTYHSWHALSHSWMNKLRQSPAHLLDLIENGGEDVSSPDRVFGSAVHCAVLEPDQYDRRFISRPEGQSGVTKEGKVFKEQSESAGLIVLDCKTGQWVQAVARKAKQNRRLFDWFKHDHQTEVSLVWERDGLRCKARADLLIPGQNIVVDLKTTITASEAGFAVQVARYHYHEQAEWYLDGLQRLSGQPWDFWFLACEKRRPFLVSAQALARGTAAHAVAKTENDRLYEKYKGCMDSNYWPGYPDVDEIKLPDWATAQAGETVDEESF